MLERDRILDWPKLAPAFLKKTTRLADREPSWRAWDA